MIPIIEKVRLAGLVQSEPDKYGGLSAKDYVLKGWNVRSVILPYCPCCGVSTSYVGSYTNKPYGQTSALNPGRVKDVGYVLVCGHCDAVVVYDRVRDAIR